MPTVALEATCNEKPRDVMTTTELRTAVKAKVPEARVASLGSNKWTIRFGSPRHIQTVRDLIAALGLKEIDHDVEGSSHDWSYVFRVRSRALA